MKKTFLLITTCLLLSSIHAQVTIGSGTKPNAGALLDLKDDGTYTNGETAVKGLGLPRVELKDLRKLQMSDGPDLTAQAAEHTGLLVYNAKANGSICPGLHVWDGTVWVSLDGGAVKPKPDITMTDTDGNVYGAKWFSADPCDPAAAGAYWTTSNLYTTKDKNGNQFVADPISGNPNGVRLNLGKYSTPMGAIVIISIADFMGTVAYGQDAASISATNQSPSMSDFAKKFGLGYTQAQAMLACPPSWSLPTDADWDALALAHGGASIAGAAMRANHDFYLANSGGPSYKWGLNDASGTTLSGFNALPSGYVYADGAYSSGFSESAFLWSATSGRFLQMFYYNSILVAVTGGANDYYSVRCIKN